MRKHSHQTHTGATYNYLKIHSLIDSDYNEITYRRHTIILISKPNNILRTGKSAKYMGNKRLKNTDRCLRPCYLIWFTQFVLSSVTSNTCFRNQ